MLSALLGNGADVQLSDARGRTAVHHAAGRGNHEALGLLLEAGASPMAIEVLPFLVMLFKLRFMLPEQAMKRWTDAEMNH